MMIVHPRSTPSDTGQKKQRKTKSIRKKLHLLQANHRANRKHPIQNASELLSTPLQDHHSKGDMAKIPRQLESQSTNPKRS